MLPGNSSSSSVDIRSQVESDAKQTDLVFFTDESEIAFVNDGARVIDLDFRENVAKDLFRRYEKIVGKKNIITLAGSRKRREVRLRSQMILLLQKALQA